MWVVSAFLSLISLKSLRLILEIVMSIFPKSCQENDWEINRWWKWFKQLQPLKGSLSNQKYVSTTELMPVLCCYNFLTSITMFKGTWWPKFLWTNVPCFQKNWTRNMLRCAERYSCVKSILFVQQSESISILIRPISLASHLLSGGVSPAVFIGVTQQ